MGRIQQIVSFLQQLWRLRSHDCGHFIEESLCARHQRGIGSLRHLASDNLLRLAESSPVVIGQPQGHLDVENIKQFNKVIRPTRRHRTGPHGVFEREVPADNPRNNLAQRSVSIRISAARQRDHSRKLRVAKSRKRAPQPGKHERKHQSRPRVVSAQPGKHEDSGSNHRADAQRRQLEYTQRAFQAMRARFSCLLQQQIEGLFRKEVSHR